MNDSPALSKIRRHNGAAGQIAYSVNVTYPGETPQAIDFIGSVYGGPVLMITPANLGGVFVTDPSRFGTFGPEWVRRFFA